MVTRPTKAWTLSWCNGVFHGMSAAVVAVFCYWTASRVPSLPETYWAPIAAVVVLYPDRDETRKASIQRFVGTAIGSLIGWASATLWHENLMFYGLSVLLAVGICYILRLEGASRLCAVTVTVITLIPRSEPTYLVAFHRFVEVSYGVACALVYTALTDWASKRWRSRRADSS
jgi:uncharacterized membrane protein YgaE (UPF0421/DUF939 family)